MPTVKRASPQTLRKVKLVGPKASPAVKHRMLKTTPVVKQSTTKSKGCSDSLAAVASPTPLRRQRLEAVPDLALCKSDFGAVTPTTFNAELVIKMLRDMLHVWQVAVKGEEQTLQFSVTNAIEETHSSSGALLKIWDQAKSAEAQAEETYRAAEHAVHNLEVKLQHSGQSIEELKSSFAAEVQAFKQRSTAVREAQIAQAALEAELVVVQAKSELVAEVQEKYLKPLRDGVHGESVALTAPLVQLLAKLNTEASMLEALPEILNKSPTDRSLTERSVLQDLERSLAAQAAALREKLGQAQQARSACAAALSKAQDDFEAASEKQRAGAHRLWGSRTDTKAAHTLMESKQANARNLLEKLHAAKYASVTAAQEWFLSVQAGPLSSCFSQHAQVQSMLPLQTEAMA